MNIRIGTGYDLHRTCPGNEIIVGGVAIESPFALEGHSDADLLMHAITDALLGALGDKDIGYYFPPSREENRGRPSVEFLTYAYDLVKKQGYSLINLDSTIICERPKIKKVREEIRENLARILQVKPSQIGIKGKTNEGVGAVGREEAVSCHAVVLLGGI